MLSLAHSHTIRLYSIFRLHSLALSLAIIIIGECFAFILPLWPLVYSMAIWLVSGLIVVFVCTLYIPSSNFLVHTFSLASGCFIYIFQLSSVLFVSLSSVFAALHIFTIRFQIRTTYTHTSIADRQQNVKRKGQRLMFGAAICMHFLPMENGKAREEKKPPHTYTKQSIELMWNALAQCKREWAP